MREASAIYSSLAKLGVFKKVLIYAAMLANMDYHIARNNGVILSGDGPFKRGKEASVAEDLGD